MDGFCTDKFDIYVYKWVMNVFYRFAGEISTVLNVRNLTCVPVNCIYLQRKGSLL